MNAIVTGYVYDVICNAIFYIFRRVADICVIFEFLEVNIARGRVSTFVDYNLYTVHQCLHSMTLFCMFCTRTLETPWRVSSATSLRTPS